MKQILLAALVLVVACKKNDDEPAGPPSREDLVGTYKQTSETTNGQFTWTNAFHESCRMDDTYRLNADGSALVTDAGALCANGPGNVQSTWTLNGTIITIAGQEANIEGYNGTNLILKRVVTTGGNTSTIIMTYTRQ